MATNILQDSSYLQLAQTLNDLLQRDGKLTPAALARKLGIPTNKITRILNGDVTDPKASTLLQIATYFDIRIEQLLGLEPLTFPKEQSVASTERQLPIFDLSKPEQPKIPREWYRWAENDVQGDYFALTVDTDLYEPVFPKDALLIVNPDIDPEDRSYVLIKQNGAKARHTIKKYVTEGNQTYLYPINPKLPVEIYDENLYNIAGVILEVHQRLRPNK